MTSGSALRCDGCGQLATPEHIARRLQRLEWATRYRPIHIAALLLGSVAPEKDSDYLYGPSGEFGGEAAFVLKGRVIQTNGKPREAVLAEFQRGGFFLAHVLECPVDGLCLDATEMQRLLESRLTSVMARIRRSLRPKKLVAISPVLNPLLDRLKESCNDLAVLES